MVLLNLLFLPLIVLVFNFQAFSSALSRCGEEFLPNHALFFHVRVLDPPGFTRYNSEQEPYILSHILENAGISSVGELVTKTEEELEDLPWSLKEENMTALKSWLSEKGLRLGMEMDWPLSKETVEAMLKQLSKEELELILNAEQDQSLFLSFKIEEPFSFWVKDRIEKSFSFWVEDRIDGLFHYRTVWAKEGDIRSLGSLVTKTERKLLALPDFDKDALREIKNMLAKRGLHLGMKLTWPPEPSPVRGLSKEELRGLLSRPIATLELGDGYHLEAAGILFIGDLVTKTEKRLVALSGLEEHSLNVIKVVLAEIRLRLGMRLDWPPDRDTLDALMREKLHKKDLHVILTEPLRKKGYLSLKDWRALTGERIFTFGDLVTRTEADLRKMSFLSEIDLIKIKALLAVRGLHLGMEVDRFLDKESVEAKINQLPKEVFNLILARYPLWRLSLTLPSKNSLIESGFLSIGDLIVTTEEELLERTGFDFNRGNLFYVKTALAERGLKLGMELNRSLESETTEVIDELAGRLFKEEMEAALSQSVETLDITDYRWSRYETTHAEKLQEAGIQSLKDLVVKTDNELYRQIKIKRAYIIQIKSELAKKGLYLGMKPEDFTL